MFAGQEEVPQSFGAGERLERFDDGWHVPSVAFDVGVIGGFVRIDVLIEEREQAFAQLAYARRRERGISR